MKEISIDVVLPVFNEEKILRQNVMRLESFLEKQKQWDWKIIIVDNASTDQTSLLAAKLKEKNKRIDFIRLKKKGRGRALKFAWGESNASVCCYMDIDLSTPLEVLPSFIDAILPKEYDIVIASRLMKGSKVEGRSLSREFLSRNYNLLTRLMFPFFDIKDLQCGFKVLNANAVKHLIPLVKDNKFFFDTELLLLAYFWRLRIMEIPVHWKDDPDSRVPLVRTILEDIGGLLRLRFFPHPPRPKAWKSSLP